HLAHLDVRGRGAGPGTADAAPGVAALAPRLRGVLAAPAAVLHIPALAAAVARADKARVGPRGRRPAHGYKGEGERTKEHHGETLRHAKASLGSVTTG